MKQNVRHKRTSEGQADIPSDLFAKKPRYEMSGEETARMNERRQKNKEAAEKSRRKKKEEFSKLQTENDQLHQDKCQLVAMIEKLKSDLNNVTKENNGLRYNIDHLKRWIGKHAGDLGLGKHMQKKQAEEKVKLTRSMKNRNSDPSLHSAGVVAGQDHDKQLSNSTSSLLPSAISLSYSSSGATFPSTSPIPKCPSLSDTPRFSHAASKCSSLELSTQDFFQPVGIRTVVNLPQLPGPLLVEKSQEDNHHSETGHQEEVIYAGGQQFLYLSKDTVFIVHSEDGQQVMIATPEVQQEIKLDTPELQQIAVGNQHVQQITEETPEVEKNSMEAREAQEASLRAPLEAQEASVEAPEKQKANVKDPEIQKASVEALEVQMTSVEDPEMQKEGVEAPEVQKASVENPEIREGSTEVKEVREGSVEGTEAQETNVEALEVQGESAKVPHASQTTVKAAEMKAESGLRNSMKKAFYGYMIEDCATTKDTTETIRDIESSTPDVNTVCQPPLASTIDFLLKMGYKIHLPSGAQLLSDPEKQL